MNIKKQTRNAAMKWAMLAMTLLGLGGTAKAASTDTIQLLVTPGVTYSVTITSADANVAYDFGTVNLNMSTRSERAAVVTNSGNISSRWQVSAQGMDTWTLANSTSAQNAAVLKALFNSRNGAQPTNANFDTVNGSTLAVATQYADNTNLSTTNAIMSSIAVNAQRDLYFMLHTPNSSSVATQQKFAVYVTAVP